MGLINKVKSIVVNLQTKNKGEKRINKKGNKNICYFESRRYCVGNQSCIIWSYLIVSNRKAVYRNHHSPVYLPIEMM